MPKKKTQDDPSPGPQDGVTSEPAPEPEPEPVPVDPSTGKVAEPEPTPEPDGVPDWVKKVEDKVSAVAGRVEDVARAAAENREVLKQTRRKVQSSPIFGTFALDKFPWEE